MSNNYKYKGNGSDDYSSEKFEKFKNKKRNKVKFNDKGKHWKRDQREGSFDQR